ncbi:hypothetical protein DENSPDRAFT_615035 [Dentipellis sp. KUC8613]|nr:hypothetical protein DENSPDRAFT_615035 [Dentipellis sp. KUC8613]
MRRVLEGPRSPCGSKGQTVVRSSARVGRSSSASSFVLGPVHSSPPTSTLRPEREGDLPDWDASWSASSRKRRRAAVEKQQTVEIRTHHSSIDSARWSRQISSDSRRCR